MFAEAESAQPKETVPRSNKQFANTQPISSLGLKDSNKLLSQSRGGPGQQPGSRRELPNDKRLIQGSTN